jgi:hypothetical protein
MTYVWHYLLARLIYDELFRHGGALALLLGVVCVAVLALVVRQRRARRRRP